MRKILVIGGGIAGVEGALTLARGLPDARVTLLAHGEMLRLMPDLLYVPIGISAHRVEVPLRDLIADDPIELVLGEVESIDLRRRVARTRMDSRSGSIPFDTVLVAPGAEPQSFAGLQLQTLAQALEVRDRLDTLFLDAVEREARASVIIRAAADDSWSPPAYEFAALLAVRRRALGLEHRISIALVTAELTPFQWFEPRVADVVTAAFEELGIELSVGMPEGRFDDLESDVIVDFGPLEARHVSGLPGRGDRGWYETSGDGRVHPAAFVLGDAAGHGYKSAFAVAWQARRALVALGGSLDLLGASVGGVPVDAAEYHVDLGLRTLRIRLPVAATMQDPWLGHDATVQLDDRPPDRLAGLLLGERLERVGGSSAAEAHRALVSRRGSPLPSGARARLASFPSP